MNHPNRSWRRRLADEAAALGPDLVSAGINILGGPTLAAMHISTLTGRNYSANLMCRWRRGEAPVPEPAREALMVVVLTELLGDESVPVARVLCVPER